MRALAILLAAASVFAVPGRAQAPVLTGPAAALAGRRAGLFPVPIKPLVRRAPLRIDTDGWIRDFDLRRRVIARDRWHQDDTKFHLDDGALDPTVVPYIVLPQGYRDADLGDLARVTYGGRAAWAVCGDRGPKRKFGEGSVALAQKLGIDPDGTTGGADSGVTYEIYPRTARFAPRTQGELLSFLWQLELGVPVRP